MKSQNNERVNNINKHSFAIAFAVIGLGIGFYLASESETGDMKYIVQGPCLGCFIGYLVAGLFTVKSDLLQKRFQELGNVRGKTLDEITEIVGNCTSYRTCTITDRNNEMEVLYTWRENRYSITLLFGADGLCIGVTNEVKL